jgi:cob(I)alamin adenosyltransferase
MGHVYLYTGMGAGKTTNALGLALRSMGHGHKVVIIQFMKWWKNTGEYKIAEKLGALKKNYKIYMFGRPGWIGLKKLTEEDRELAKRGLVFAEKILKKKPHLLVLDEINLALHCKLLDIKDVLRLLKRIPHRTNVVLTGRNAPPELIARADFVNVIKDVKHPKKLVAVPGIQY